MGNRPVEVDALLTSVAKQDVAPTRIVIVGNGCPLPEFAERLGLPGEVTAIELDDNLGCPGGRNVGLSRLREFGDVDVVVELFRLHGPDHPSPRRVTPTSRSNWSLPGLGG
ncbi:glycosyltransferase family 2 protein, partial [Streptomyces sp. NPDC005141]